jgi:hypothetical protein
MSDHGSMEKKVGELQSNETRLQQEIDTLKAERDRKIFDNQKLLEKERDNFKGKLSDIEQKCKDLENKRSTMLFELEKERAKWGLEKDYLFSQKQEIQEKFDSLNRRWDQIQRENEKLKQEKLNNKRQYGGGAGGASGVSTGYASKFTASSFGLMKSSIAKENSGVNGSQAFASGFSKFISDGANYGSGSGIGANALNSDKPDPHTLPMAFKDTNANGARFGSAYTHIKTASSGSTSFKSGQNNNNNIGASGAFSASADENNSNKDQEM